MNYSRIPLGPIWTNSYIVDDGCGSAVCFDVGGSPEAVISRLRIDKMHLLAIILTHGHMDHILGVGDLKRETGAELYVPELDEPMLSDPSKSLAMQFGYGIEPLQADHIVHDNDMFNIGKLSIMAMHTPGHTPGSTSYLLEQEDKKLLISGDTLFARSIGRTDLPGGDYTAIMNSVARLAALDGDMPVLPGHGPETTLDVERQLNPYIA